MSSISVEWIFGRPATGAEDDEARAAAAAESVLAAAKTEASAAYAEYMRQWSDFDDEAAMSGIALIWIEARNAADVAATLEWYNPDGASVSISAW